MDYDVFISCKSEDYKYAEEVYDFLKGEGVNAFLASKELRRMKESEYMDSISSALDSAYHLIIFASEAENITSKWVKFEWSTFLNEKLSGFKDGQLMTILKDISVRQAPIQLRHYESFTFDDYKDKLLSYVETPAFLARKEEEKKRAQELADAKKKKEEEEKKKEEVKQELIKLAKDYSTKVSALSTDAKEIDAKMRFVGITHRTCPVCQSQVEISENFCPTCGWTISPIVGIEDAEYLLNDNPAQLEILKNCARNISLDSANGEHVQDLHNCIDGLKQEIEKLKKEHESYVQSHHLGTESSCDFTNSFKSPKENIEFDIDGAKFNMIYVEGGTFKMGDKSLPYNEGPVHNVTLDSFFIAETVVTQKLWINVMGESSFGVKGDERPAYNLSYDKCVEFIDKLNTLSGEKFRLPTEAEWEYAARGGAKSLGYRFSGSNDSKDVAWHDLCFNPLQVKLKQPNELGIYDMSGNVEEWCSDKYAAYTREDQINPQGAKQSNYRVTRGGSFRCSVKSGMLEVYGRSSNAPELSANMGLRLVLGI